MTSSAVIFMLVTVLIVWGGLVASVVALVVRGRRQGRETQTAVVMETLESERSEPGVAGFKQGESAAGSEDEGTVGSEGESEA
ncbi:MAG: MetS family NSS transporter small subunit [Peptidiphaga gingivicola]